jgi:hypothetical protein
MHRFDNGGFILLYGLNFFTNRNFHFGLEMSLREATFEGMHTPIVVNSLRLGFLLFYQIS